MGSLRELGQRNVKGSICTCTFALLFVLTTMLGPVDALNRVLSPIKRVSTTRPMVALTFDDGPSATFTPQILAVLNRYHAKATFFVIGSRAEKFPNLIQAELASRDEVANHSYHHTVLIGKSSAQIQRELSMAQHAIGHASLREPPHLFRPPAGLSNEPLLRVADEQHYRVVLWSVDSRDWADPGVTQITKNVMSHVHNGDIIIFHDQGGNRRQTVQALQRIVPELSKRGFELVTVSDLLCANGQ